MAHAEIMLVAGDLDARESSPKDGDVIRVRTAHGIATKHAEHLCKPKDVIGAKRVHRGVDENGLLPPNSIQAKFYAATSEYRIDRRSLNEYQITRIADGEQSPLIGRGDVWVGWDGKKNAGDIRQMVANRLRPQVRRARRNSEGDVQIVEPHASAPTFGSPGREFWFCGRTNKTPAIIDSVWDMIETETPHRRADHLYAPVCVGDGKIFAFLRIEDVTESRAQLLTTREFDMTEDELDAARLEWMRGGSRGPEPVRTELKFRKHRVDFRALLSAGSIAEIDDRTSFYDRRSNSIFTDAAIVEVKP